MAVVTTDGAESDGFTQVRPQKRKRAGRPSAIEHTGQTNGNRPSFLSTQAAAPATSASRAKTQTQPQSQTFVFVQETPAPSGARGALAGRMDSEPTVCY